VNSRFIRIFGFILIFLGLTGFISNSANVHAQEVGGRRAQLERDLARLEAEIDKQKKILEEKKNERVSLERDIAILNAKIKKAKLSIQARSIAIQKLSNDINGKRVTITKLSDKIDREKSSLAGIIRKTRELDQYSLPEIVLSSRNLSDFLEDAQSFESVKSALQNSFQELNYTRNKTTIEKEALEERKREETELRALQELEKRKVEKEEAERREILAKTKGVEEVYQRVVKTNEKSAAAIRSELFLLRDTAAIPFEKALYYANLASSKTGVRPALILGIIAEESNLGENVGKGNWRVDMKAPRDTVPFLDITSRLGLDPDKMPVSKKAWYGYGGAMGPAQFIPSTWILYESKITSLTGHNPPNPWNPEDAFMASALLLKDNGAAVKTPQAERLAALRYLAGWTNATKSAYAFYGDDVMELAEKFQKQIDILNRN